MRGVLVGLALALLLVPTSVGQDDGAGAGDEGVGEPPRGPPDGRGGGGPPNNGSANASDNESGNASVASERGGGPPAERGPPTWKPTALDDGEAAFPLDVQGRFLSFIASTDGITELTIHQEPFAELDIDLGELVSAERLGNQVIIETTTASIRAVDVPATQLHIAGVGLTTELPPTTELTSGARVTLTTDADGLHLQVTRPDGVLGAAPATTLSPDRVRPMAPGRTGLVAGTDGESLGVEASEGRLRGVFASTEDDAEIAFDVGLVRAMLIDDVDGDGALDVGEPSLAEMELTNGTAQIDNGMIVETWALWAGTLSAVSELDAHTLKITYIVEGLAAPPGSLFVLESIADAPGDAELSATALGAVARSGSLEARYGVDGPVTVDGEQAWADSMVQVADDGTVHVFVSYPAGDEIVHDPQVAIASLPGLTALRAASPAAIALGVALAVAFVVGTVWLRRR